MNMIDHFRGSLSRSFEKKFFEISRNFLGDVKTPYNKQTVIERLVSCIASPELQKVLFSYVTDDEAYIINTIELLGNPSLHDIYDFWADSFSFSKCLRLVTRLEERLIVYSFIDFGVGLESYALNPMFARPLQQVFDNKDALFPGVKKSAEPGPGKVVPQFPINKQFLLEFFSFVHTGKLQRKKDEKLTKKAEDAAAAFFQDDHFFKHYFSGLFSALSYLRLFLFSNRTFDVNMTALENFLKLSEQECLAYLAAEMCGHTQYTSLVINFLASLSPDTWYTEIAIYRIISIVFHKISPTFSPSEDYFLDVLCRTGLIIESKDPETEQKWYTLPSREENQEMPIPIVFDSPFSFVVLPHTDPSALFDIIHFASVENIREHRFTVNKETVVRCFDSNADWEKEAGVPEKNAAWIIDRLKTFSGGRLDETLVWTVGEWEKRFNEVVLHDGLVLYLSKEREYLAETTELKPYLERAITERVFVVNPANRKTVEAALKKSGVDIIGGAGIPSSTNADSIKDRTALRRVLFPALPPASLTPQVFTGKGKRQTREEPPVPAVDYRKKFKAILALLNPAENERRELLTRIDRGLIFCEDQLKKLSLPGTFPYEKNEARGMDYSGKLLVAKNAFSSGSEVEIVWQTDGAEKNTRCMIENIEKRQSGDILVVSTSTDEIQQKIPLGKVSMIKRIKQSLFE